MDWPSLKALMLHEPKPPMSFVIHQRDPLRTRSARVLHDGDRKWLIWSSEKLEVNNGVRAVFVSGGRIESHQSANLYSHGWIKSLVHPQLTNLGDEEDFGTEVEGWDIERVSDGPYWRLKMSGLVDEDDTVFTVEVDERTGSFVSQRHPSVDAVMKLEELQLDVSLAGGVFEWLA